MTIADFVSAAADVALKGAIVSSGIYVIVKLGSNLPKEKNDSQPIRRVESKQPTHGKTIATQQL